MKTRPNIVASHLQKFLLGAVLALCACAVVSGVMASPVAAPGAADRAQILEGEQLFEKRCAICHGFGGTGDKGPNLRRPQLQHATTIEDLKRVIRTGISPDMPSGPYLAASDVDALAAYVQSLGRVPPEPIEGDPVRGRAVYERSGCAACHILKGEGVGMGPELTSIGSQRGAARLRRKLEVPGEAIIEGFQLVDITDQTGTKTRGVRLNEDSVSIQVRDLSGDNVSFLKKNVVKISRDSKSTLMPSYKEILTSRDMKDLIAYLASQRR